jgi:hypothetical protein
MRSVIYLLESRFNIFRLSLAGEGYVATLPADEDYAKSVLSIFHAKQIRAGQTLRSGQVRIEFLAKNMGRQTDYEAALEYAIDRSWLRLDLNMIRLTDAGFAEQ